MYELNYVEIGKRIKCKRKENNFTQEKLAEIINVSPSYISEIERGGSICSLATITNIAYALQTNLDYLVYGITIDNSSKTFTEILKSIPSNNHSLFLNLCENIANCLKKWNFYEL